MRIAARLLIAVSVGTILGYAALHAIQISRAKSLLLDSIREMRSWRVPPDPGTWSSVNTTLQVAAGLSSADPTLHEVRGLLGLIRSDNAADHIAQALARRPTSPHAWAHLAEARYRAGEPGRNLELPLRLAVDLGPAEPGVQRLVADYGLAVWNEVAPVTQAAIDRMVAAGIRRNPLEMLQISERRGRLEAACRHLAGSSRLPGSRRGSLCPWEITP